MGQLDFFFFLRPRGGGSVSPCFRFSFLLGYGTIYDIVRFLLLVRVMMVFLPLNTL